MDCQDYTALHAERARGQYLRFPPANVDRSIYYLETLLQKPESDRCFYRYYLEIKTIPSFYVCRTAVEFS